MADTPNTGLPWPSRECPTCGNKVLPEETDCSLCGTTLQGDVPLPFSQDDATPILVVPPPSAAPSPAVNLPPVSPPPSSPPPANLLKAAGVLPSSPASAQPAPLPGQTDFPGTRPGSQSVLPRLVSLLAPATFKWIELIGAALALIILSFLAGYFINGRTQSQETRSSVMPPPPPPPPQNVGQVTTAEQLMPVYVFGAGVNDALRGAAAFRTRVEEGLQKIRDAYTVQLVKNPLLLGTMVLEFRVTPAGQVSRAAIHATGNLSSDLQQLALNIVKNWRFPSTQGEEVKVFYPLLFSPEKVEAATLVARLTEVWPGRYKVLAATPVPVRVQASVGAEEVGEIGPGLKVNIISSREGWLEVLSPEGEVGYIHQEAISPRVENPVSG